MQQRYPILLALALCPLLFSHAQETLRQESSPLAIDSLPPRNTAGILIDRNLNTFTWNGRAFLDTTVAGIHTTAREQYSATVVQLESDPTRRLQSNQQQALIGLALPLGRGLGASAEWNSFIFTDSRGIGISTASMHTLLAGLDYAPLPFLTISPAAGYRWDNQSGLRDRGTVYRLGTTMRETDFDGYLVDAQGQYREDHLDPRRLENHFLRAGVQKMFGPMTRDSLEIGLYRLRREFYAPDSSIESRQENVFQLANLLSYALEQSIRTSFFFSMSSRQLGKLLLYGALPRPTGTFDTNVDEFHLDTYLEGAWHSEDGRSDAAVRFGYSERNELHGILSAAGQTTGPLFQERLQQEESKNNLARRTMLAGRMGIPFSWSDYLQVSASASLLRYDTPSDLNREDRDELLVAASIGTLHHLSPVLDLEITLDGTLSHLVYLLSDRSANNNINRIIRLAPRTFYRPSSSFVSMNAFEVLASYTVYDFEQAAAVMKSFSYRQFSWMDSTSLDLTDRVGLDFFAYLKLYERGQLKWAEFKERTENSYVDRNFMVQARFSPGPGMSFAVGVRLFSQSRYSYGPEGKVPDAYTRSIGPTCAVLWNPGPRSQVLLRGWYENRRQIDGRSRGLTTLMLSLLLNF